MSKNFPTKEHLEDMSTAAIRSQRPEDIGDEALMAEVLGSRVAPQSFDDKIQMNDAKNAVINNPEEEAKWQAILDERRKEVKERQLGKEAVITEEIQKLEDEKEKIEEEIKTLEPSIEEINVEKPIVEQKIDARSTIKCTLCGSKSKAFHRRGCPTLVKE